ncbi:esterase [Streptacidiphilus sp. PB12-B1b]|nr:esterase [Streptacidiphilus sp. PB12-B1b]
MPSGYQGVLVHRVPHDLTRPVTATWLPENVPLRFGQIRLRWDATAASGRHVTAHLGLHSTEVHLATWTSADEHWPALIRPTLHEVSGLCAALRLATTALAHH